MSRSRRSHARRIASRLAALATLATSFALPLPVASLAAQRPTIAHGMVEPAALHSAHYPWKRRLWVYTPPGYAPRRATPYPLLVAFDGRDYLDTAGLRLPRILDSLLDAGRLPPLVAVLVDDSSSTVRTAELGNSATFATFLADELLPWVRLHWNVTRDPHRTLVTGSSAGGVGAAFVALSHPELFGNVLSQSGAFWRGPDGANGPAEWLTGRVAAWPKRDVKFLLDVGALETARVLGGSGPVFIDAHRRFRDALLRRGYAVQYTEVPMGRHAPDSWRARLPADLVTIAGRW